MRKTVLLSGLAALFAASMLWPSPSYSASKGRAAAAPSGKSTASPPSSKSGRVGIESQAPKYLEYRLDRATVKSYGKRSPKGRLQDLPGTKDVDKASARRK